MVVILNSFQSNYYLSTIIILFILDQLLIYGIQSFIMHKMLNA